MRSRWGSCTGAWICAAIIDGPTRAPAALGPRPSARGTAAEGRGPRAAGVREGTGVQRVPPPPRLDRLPGLHEPDPRRLGGHRRARDGALGHPLPRDRARRHARAQAARLGPPRAVPAHARPLRVLLRDRALARVLRARPRAVLRRVRAGGRQAEVPARGDDDVATAPPPRRHLDEGLDAPPRRPPLEPPP